MASNTDYLGLLKKDPVADASDTFNIQTMLNDNWDLIDRYAACTPMIKVGHYDGTGNNGPSYPCEINNIGFVPEVVIVRKTGLENDYALTMIRPCTKILPSQTTSFIAWGNDSVRWCVSSADGGGVPVERQCNQSNVTYYYVVLGHKEESE